MIADIPANLNSSVESTELDWYDLQHLFKSLLVVPGSLSKRPLYSINPLIRVLWSGALNTATWRGDRSLSGPGWTVAQLLDTAANL